MILFDTSAFVALIDEDDEHHQACKNAFDQLPRQPLVTTWACVTEAMYLAYSIGRYPAQERIWLAVERQLITFHIHTDSERLRMRELMKRYRDVPMDFADASLVAAAEALKINRIFTFDSDFHAYRLFKNQSFILIPSG